MNIQVENWEVRDLELNPEKVQVIWKALSRHMSLFSDLTRGDFSNFVRVLQSDHSMWFEVRRNGILLGLIYFSELYQVVDVNAHMAFFDRNAYEKMPVCREVVKWMFKNFPIHRMSVSPPTMYRGTVRLLDDMGFVREGVRREGVLITGKWRDQVLFGITRTEVEAWP